MRWSDKGSKAPALSTSIQTVGEVLQRTAAGNLRLAAGGSVGTMPVAQRQSHSSTAKMNLSSGCLPLACHSVACWAILHIRLPSASGLCSPAQSVLWVLGLRRLGFWANLHIRLPPGWQPVLQVGQRAILNNSKTLDTTAESRNTVLKRRGVRAVEKLTARAPLVM